MITPPTPQHANVTIGTAGQHQDQSQASDLSNLGRSDVSDYFKSLRLRHYIEQIIAKNEQQGVLTDVSIIDLQSGQSIVDHKADTEQFAASVNKLPIAQLILTDLRSGKLTMDQTFTWTVADVRAGAGVFDQPGAPTQGTVKELLFDMLNPSGNTAVRAFVNGALGGAATVNERIKSELGLQHTYLQPLDATRFYVGNSTAADAAKTVQLLLSNQDTYGAFIKNALATNIYTDYGVRSQLAGNDFIVLANKVGILDDVDGNNRHDVGIVYNTKTHKSYVYAFMNTAQGAAYNTPTAQAGISLADMGAGVLRYAGDKSANTATKAFNSDHQPGHRVRY
jgi:beta-lactamase class A